MDGRALKATRPFMTERRIAMIVLGCGIVAIVGLILAAGESPLRVLAELVRGGFLTSAGLGDTVVRAIPLCLIGLGIACSFRAGVFNIGGDGQLLIGSCAAMAAVPLATALPAPLGLAILLLFGMAGGAFWGLIAGVLKARFGANEIIATIMLNYIAAQVLSWLVRGPLQEATGMFPRTEKLPEGLRLPVLIEGTRISSGALIAAVAVAIIWLLLSRSRWGFGVTLTGQNPDAARYGGFRPSRVTVSVLTLGGALAGLAGTVEISGLHGRLQEGFATGFGVTAIAVALLARLNPLWVPVTAFGFAGLYVGSSTVARTTSVPFPLVNVIEAAIIMGFLALTMLRRPSTSE